MNLRQGRRILARILIIEDNQLAARNTAIFLTENGHTVEVASDGIKAIQAAQWFRPEIVLSDLGLPDLDGYGVAETFRRDPAFTNSMYLIAVTGYGQDEDKRRALDAGFNAHLTRPVDLTALEEMIASLHPDAADIGKTSSRQIWIHRHSPSKVIKPLWIVSHDPAAMGRDPTPITTANGPVNCHREAQFHERGSTGSPADVYGLVWK